jgi:hypothetical protein
MEPKLNELLPQNMWQMSDMTLKVGEYMSNPTHDGYECIVRKLSEHLHGKHYCEESAMRDVYKIRYSDNNGAEHRGPHWTVEQVEAATAGKKFPEGTTTWDKYIAYNNTYADLCKILPEEQILKVAYAMWFADEDWKGEGKIWEYMGMNK